MFGQTDGQRSNEIELNQQAQRRFCRRNETNVREEDFSSSRFTLMDEREQSEGAFRVEIAVLRMFAQNVFQEAENRRLMRSKIDV